MRVTKVWAWEIIILLQEFLRREIWEKSSDKGDIGQRCPLSIRKTMKINFISIGATTTKINYQSPFLICTINMMFHLASQRHSQSLYYFLSCILSLVMFWKKHNNSPCCPKPQKVFSPWNILLVSKLLQSIPLKLSVFWAYSLIPHHQVPASYIGQHLIIIRTMDASTHKCDTNTQTRKAEQKH